MNVMVVRRPLCLFGDLCVSVCARMFFNTTTTRYTGVDFNNTLPLQLRQRLVRLAAGALQVANDDDADADAAFVQPSSLHTASRQRTKSATPVC